jgi:hypothetical protein
LSEYKSNDAQVVKKNILYENFKTRQIKSDKYVLNNEASDMKKPIVKKLLAIETFETFLGLYYASVNNVELAIIDDVKISAGQVQMMSNFRIDNTGLEDLMKTTHIENIYMDEKVDYMVEYSNMLMKYFGSDGSEQSKDEGSY